MQSTLALREKANQLLAADAATLAPATDANTMCLVKSNFNPTEQITVDDLELADFDGSAPLEVETGTQPEGLDPVSSASVITLKPPAGGWRWETTGVTNLPQTIYGRALMNDDQTILFAVEKFTTPIILTASNQVINLAPATLTQAANSLT